MGTYDQTGRDAIQEEADNILDEIDRISKTTEFNGILEASGKERVALLWIIGEHCLLG